MSVTVRREVVLDDRGDVLIVSGDGEEGRRWRLHAAAPLYVSDADLARFAQFILDELVPNRCPAVYVDGDGRPTPCSLAAFHDDRHVGERIGAWGNTIDPWPAATEPTT